ncbi:ABC transporter ATP-binding protein [Ruminococcus sp.]|uniref:ABC transporter ATP-binding protein n=1 Tax=Ruminococcus sp. TaxID=41978 RepID=UPI003AF7F339
MIEIKDLSLTFKNADEDHEALKAVTLDIPEGCIYGFVGSNGAGKSTLLRVISGIYRPDSGSVTIDGKAVYDQPQAKENIFFVSDETVQFSRLSVNDLKGFFKLTYPRFDEEVFDELVTKLDLPRKKPLSQFSKGMKRQAIVAAALACRTKYILLDEAFDGLDPAMRKLIRTMIVDDIFDRGATLVVSSHNITEIGELCDKAMLLHKGEVIFAKDIDDVREGFEKVQIALPEGELDRSAIENAGVEVLSFKKLGRISTVVAKGEKADITAKLSALSPAVLELVPLTLEEIFIYEMEVRGYAVSSEEDK